MTMTIAIVGSAIFLLAVAFVCTVGAHVIVAALNSIEDKSAEE